MQRQAEHLFGSGSSCFLMNPEDPKYPKGKEKKMKRLMLSFLAVLLAAGAAFAQMGGGHMGNGHMGGGMSSGQMSGGSGYGMHGAGGMSSMMGNTMSHGYLDVLDPLSTSNDARTAIQAFIDSANSNLQISELWEYGMVYKVELSDANGEMAFDLSADKFTGAVTPEMGLSMMMNASYGRALYRMPSFGKKLKITTDQARGYAQSFVDKTNLGYTLGTAETYPGYYKFHTTDSAGKFGMDIMVNGYDGKIWMNTILGVPIGRY